MKKTKSKRKPQDSTMRNVRAANKRLAKNEREIKQLGVFTQWLDAHIHDIYEQLDKLTVKLNKAVR